MSLTNPLTRLAAWPRQHSLPKAWQRGYWIPALVPGLFLALADTVQFLLYPVFRAPNVSNLTQAIVTFVVFYGPVALIPRVIWSANRRAGVAEMGVWHVAKLQAAILLVFGSLHLAAVTLGLAIMHSPPGWGPHLPRFYGEIWLTEFPRWALVYGLVAVLLGWLQSAGQKKAGNEIEVRENGRLHYIPRAEICWVEATGNYACLHTEDRTFTLRTSLNAFETRLGEGEFIRVHRSAIVRPSLVRAIRQTGPGRFEAILANGDGVPLSRRRVKALRNAMG